MTAALFPFLHRHSSAALLTFSTAVTALVFFSAARMSSDYDSDDGGGAGGLDFAAIDSQAHTSLTMEEANKLHRQKLMGQPQ